MTWEEVRKHATQADAWIVVRGKVYDVTKYMAGHPGGPQWILDFLGKDATKAFDSKGGLGTGHTDFAKAEMEKLLVGTVE